MSRTALLVAACRDVATHDPKLRTVCADPVAERLLPGWLTALVRNRSALSRALRRPSRALVEHLALRTAIIDEALRNALADGIGQVVLLGAGLDGRAHRIHELDHAHVFEVDRAPMLARKRRSLQGLSPYAAHLAYVPTDFEQGALGPDLEAAGHDRTRPCFWIWEGVAMYLEPAAMEATLSTLSARSAPGSGAAITYATPELGVRSSAAGRLGALGLAMLSEPLRCTLSESEMHARCERLGFAVVSDELPPLAAQRFGLELGRRPRLFAPAERVLVLRR